MFQHADKDNQQLHPLLFKATGLPFLAYFLSKNITMLAYKMIQTSQPNFHKTWHEHHATRCHLNAILSIFL
jgi:DNA-binding GntR family transcriptional regulator